MKLARLLALMLLAIGLTLASPGAASANDYQRTNNDNPMRIFSYGVHAIGTGLEWAIARPVHWLVSRPHARIIFGHSVRPDDIYFEWKEYQ